MALVFPGQGSQYVGMGKDWYDNSEVARKMYDTADSVVGFNISKTLFDGPEDEIKKTAITQPAIFIHSAVAYEVSKERLGERLQISAAAGHSLGEYTALYAAGSLDFAESLRLVRFRGELMQWCGEVRPGTMAAIIGLDERRVETICSEISSVGVVQPANFNSPGQVVISGDVPAVKLAMQKCKSEGAKMVKELFVSGAFHSPLMEPALKEFEKALERAIIRNPKFPVYSNVTAQPVRDALSIRKLLLEQLTKPVRWQQSIENMHTAGINRFLEVGPGKVLQGLIKRICGECEIYGVDKLSDLESFTL
ncbi:MAG: ACP S-malonyltransferase [Candidatus Kryptoniota bacterium]